MRILVTGLGGFTGGYVKTELEAQGYQVAGLSSDLTDAAALAAEVAAVNPQAVLHLAAIAHIDHADAEAFYRVNLVGTRNLLDAVSRRAPAVEAVMLTSSANIYGNNPAGSLDENTPANPANDYAVSKWAMELMARLWFERLPIFIVRPFNYTGVGQDEKFVIPRIVAHFRARSESMELGNIDVRREFGDVRAVAAIYRRLLQLKPLGQTVNVCTGRAYSIGEAIDICAGITGHEIEARVNPELVRRNDVRKLAGDNTKLRELIGDWPAFELEQTLAWMLAQGDDRA